MRIESGLLSSLSGLCLFPLTNQDFAVQELPSTQKIQHVESVDAEEQGQPQRSYEQREKNVHEKARQQLTPNKAGGEKKYEPCPRWKNLGLVSPSGYVIIPLIRCVYQVLGIPLVEETSFSRLRHTCSVCRPAVAHYKEMVIWVINLRTNATITDYPMI